tara:strand:- start:360 stop:476 length:117 start_codon:yes stop_codon:yes gene_type:complete
MVITVIITVMPDLHLRLGLEALINKEIEDIELIIEEAK